MPPTCFLMRFSKCFDMSESTIRWKCLQLSWLVIVMNSFFLMRKRVLLVCSVRNTPNFLDNISRIEVERKIREFRRKSAPILLTPATVAAVRVWPCRHWPPMSGQTSSDGWSPDGDISVVSSFSLQRTCCPETGPNSSPSMCPILELKSSETTDQVISQCEKDVNGHRRKRPEDT